MLLIIGKKSRPAGFLQHTNTATPFARPSTTRCKFHVKQGCSG